MYDVIIAGAGVVGAFIARELSKYELKICVLEKENDVASGASRANSGIVHAGYDCEPGSLKALLNLRGSAMMEETAQELDVPYKRTGSLVVGFDENDRLVLERLMHRGNANGVKGLQILDRGRIKELEPNAAGEALYALYAPSAGIVCPYELTAAAVENAVINGAELRRGCEVTAVRPHDGHVEVEAGGRAFVCRFFINAAGVYSGKVAAMAGDSSFAIKPRKGEYLLLDKTVGQLVNRVIFQCPTVLGKGVLVTPAADGNILIGPNAEDVNDPEDCSTTGAGLANVLQGARRAVPGIDQKDVITSFAGLRARAAINEGMESVTAAAAHKAGDFIIGPSHANPHFINVAGVDSPGLSCAPAIGEHVRSILAGQGLVLIPKRDYRKGREKVVRFKELQAEELDGLLKRDPSYGRLVCRCEKVTEGEIVDSIRRPAGALDLDSVKRRTRAGMGRCQGGFCTPRIVELLSRELGIPYEEVTKSGGNSRLLSVRTK